jgi:hypothetical protein
MRAITLLFLLVLLNCRGADQPLPVSSLELRAPDLYISLNAAGDGWYQTENSRPTPVQKTIRTGPAGFERLLSQVAPFRSQSGPTDETARRFLSTNCPDGVPYVTDNGALSIRWMGKAVDQIYIADLGCDYERNAARNERLFTILESLPVPEPMALP